MYVKHNQEFLKSPDGKSLYSRWRNIRRNRCEEWNDFDKFAEWALENGFSKDLQLKRFDDSEEFKPGNCYFHKGKDRGYFMDSEEFCKRWDKTVNRIRKHYGLEPIGRR